MRQEISLVTLALSVALVPMALAQGSQKPKNPYPQPGTELIAWSQAQKPNPVPSPKPVPLPDQQPEQRPDTQQPTHPAYGQQDDAQKPSAAQSFAGTILKSGDKYVLKTADNMTYQLDDQSRAQSYEGKQVQVTGSLDTASNTIKVQDIKAAA